MNIHLLRLHARLVILVLLFIASTLFICLSLGQLKAWAEIEWLDILGEGGIVIITLLWLFFTLISRPGGKVTSWLVSGLLFMHISMLIDLLDEFLHYPRGETWMSAIESLPAPIGMILTSLGLYWWHREQMVLNQQLRRRERLFRQPDLIDYITGLYSAEYMLQQIELEIKTGKQFSLLMLDIDQFDSFVCDYGDEQADRFLREISELLLMNIRLSDLACRYAGDRFILLLPDTNLAQANQIAKQVQKAVSHLAFKPQESTQAVYQSISISGCQSYDNANALQLIAELNQQMLQLKQNKLMRTKNAQLV